MSIKNYIKAARLRTLPLSISGIILGSFLALSSGFFDWYIFILPYLQQLDFKLFQILQMIMETELKEQIPQE